MGRINDARGEEALSVAAELIAILGELAEDRVLLDGFQNGMSVGGAASRLLAEHGAAVLKLFALDDGITPEEEGASLPAAAVPAKFLALLKDPGFSSLFGSAAAENGKNGSSAA